MVLLFFFFKQKTAYEMRISDWSSDVCSSDLVADYLDDLWPRGDRAQDILADREFGDVIDEAAHDGQRDVGLEQGDSHFAHRRAHVGLGQRAAAAELPENVAKPIAQTVEHAPQILVTRPATQNTPVSETSPTSGIRGQCFPSRTSICPKRKMRADAAASTQMGMQRQGGPFEAPLDRKRGG